MITSKVGGYKMYITIMYGITGEYITEYDTQAAAEAAAENIRGLGYDCKVKKITVAAV